jgi:large subunit ribosomal protein L2
MPCRQSQTDFARPPRRGQGGAQAPAQGQARGLRCSRSRSSKSGRNNNGHITTRHKGGGHKHHYRSSTSVATRTASRPRSSASSTTRTARPHRPGVLRRRRAPLHHRPARRGSRRHADERRRGADQAGQHLPIRNIPVGSTIHCVEMMPGKGAQIARSAGTSVTLLAREGTYAQVASALRRDPQGAHRLPRHHRRGRQRGAQPAPVGKAGAKRWRASARRCVAPR